MSGQIFPVQTLLCSDLLYDLVGGEALEVLVSNVLLAKHALAISHGVIIGSPVQVVVHLSAVGEGDDSRVEISYARATLFLPRVVFGAKGVQVEIESHGTVASHKGGDLDDSAVEDSRGLCILWHSEYQCDLITRNKSRSCPKLLDEISSCGDHRTGYDLVERLIETPCERAETVAVTTDHKGQSGIDLELCMFFVVLHSGR